MKHKTSYRNRSRVRLPVVADAFGLTGGCWARSWLEARKKAGLEASRDGFLMPTAFGRLDHLTFGSLRATTAEISILIKELLMSAEAGWDLARTGAHSLKPTLLSWCAKFGLSLALCRKLGGHAKARDKAVLAYSRDELSEPMRALQRVLKAVNDGVFVPDATQSGLWRGAPADSSTAAQDTVLPEGPDSLSALALLDVGDEDIPGDAVAAAPEDVEVNPVLASRDDDCEEDPGSLFSEAFAVA